MKITRMILLTIMSFVFLLYFCDGEGDQEFADKKLEVRQTLDEIILDLDKELERYREKFEVQTGADTVWFKNSIEEIQKRRDQFDKMDAKIDTIGREEWKPFAAKVDTLIMETQVKLEQLDKDFKDMNMPLPYQ